MTGRRNPGADWYKEAFRHDYLCVYSHRNDEEAFRQIDFLLNRIEGSVNDILDLGCGDGRHALELARRGFRVTGLDLSADLLNRARSRAADEDLDITFIQGDMRESPGIALFDLVVCFFTSFGYFQEDCENIRVLEAIAQTLRPDGQFLLDYLNRDFVLFNLVPEDRREMDGTVVEQTRWITGDPQQEGSHVRINKQVRIRDGFKERTYGESVRMYTLSEMRFMLGGAGLAVTGVYGDFDGRPVDQESSRNIFIGRSAPCP